MEPESEPVSLDSGLTNHASVQGGHDGDEATEGEAVGEPGPGP